VHRRVAIARGACCASAALIALAGAAHAEEASGLVAPTSHARIGYERVKFPDNEYVGLLGTTYLVDVRAVPGLSAGPAVYGAITGNRGGFFTIGGEVAWRSQLAGPLGVELGLYAGGGGGAGAPQGGGLMLRPHADLLWDFGPLALGLSISRVYFPNGEIDGTQLGLVLNAIDQFRVVPASRLDTPVRNTGRAGFGFDRIQVVGGAYVPRSDWTLTDGRPAPGTIGYVGVRAEQGIDANVYWGLEANGATQSEVAGYAEYLGTIGYESEWLRDRLNVGARIALGMGGGGGIPTAGGLLAKVSLYGVIRLGNEFGLALEGGATDAPRGDFRAVHASASLVWALDGPGGLNTAQRPTRTDFSFGVEGYDAARTDGSTSPLENVVLKIDRYLSHNFYLTGQVHSAITGGAGGYSSAFVGGGWYQPLPARFHVGAELIAGAAGGGGVDSGGAVGQASAYLGYQLTPTLALRVGTGRLQALRGPLASTVVDLSLVTTYGVSAGS